MSTANGAARTDYLSDHRVMRAEREPATDGLLTAEQLADRWQLDGGKAAVYRLTRNGQIPTVRLGKFYRYRLSAILAFEEAGGTDDGE